MPQIPNMEELLAQAVRRPPRVHPNGFIQIDLDDPIRLHVWHPRLPYRQRTYHPVHDHVFGFTSCIVSGRLINVHYRTVMDRESGTHVRWQAECTGGQESVLRCGSDVPFRLVMLHSRAMQPGQIYRFEPHEFHETLSNEPTMTVMYKDGPTAHEDRRLKPTIMVPTGVTPDNDFRRDRVDMACLFDLIREAHPNP